MSRWLKFSDLVINPKYISKILISPEQIDIRIESRAHTGDLSGNFIFMSGSVDTKYKDHLVLTKKDHEGAYNTVKEWISKLE